MQKQEEMIGIVWAIVLIQGAITVLSFVEALAMGAAQGIPLVPALVLTGGGAALAFVSARGLRRSKRWARRVTLVAESLILAWGTINALASIALTQHVGLMALLTTIAAPVVVIVMLRRTKPLFAKPVPEAVA